MAEKSIERELVENVATSQSIKNADLLSAIISLGEKLDKHSDTDIASLNEIRSILLGDGREPGLAGRLDRIEQREHRRLWQMQTLAGAVIAIGITLVAKLMDWIGK